MPINLAIIDDHPLAISGIKSMLSTYPNIQVTQTYNTAASLMIGLTKSQPQVLLLDIMLPDQSGKELAPIIAAKYPNIQIIALTSLDAPAVVQNMMKHGCKGFLLKGTSQNTLVRAIEQVSKGEEFIEPSIKELLLDFMLKNWKYTEEMLELTPREKEILKLISDELTTQEIADKLFISFRTVEAHRYNLLQKLGVKNTAGLVKMALKLGLVE